MKQSSSDRSLSDNPSSAASSYQPSLDRQCSFLKLILYLTYYL